MIQGRKEIKMLKIIDCNKTELSHKMREKNTYCFGAGKLFLHFLQECHPANILAVIDNDINKQGEAVAYDENRYDMISLQQYLDRRSPNDLMIITSYAFDKMIEQLDALSISEEIECVVYLLTRESVEQSPEIHVQMPSVQMIPKTIHYCWFGQKEIPDALHKNIESWKKYCQDYEIIQWNESNYDVNKCLYMQQAYEAKKWAFVADYARIDVLNMYGGIYFDTDVEVIKSFDEFLVWELFAGFESDSYVASGLGMGAVQNQRILAKILEYYNHHSFVKIDGIFDETPCPVLESNVLKQEGFTMNGQFQMLNGVAIYPRDYFNPRGYVKGLGNITKNTHSIHKFEASWCGEQHHNQNHIMECKVAKVRERIGNQKGE